AGARLNALGELDGVAIDLGSVISSRAAREYDRERWLGAEPLVTPTPSKSEVVLEFAAHPAARLYVGPSTSYELDGKASGIRMLPASDRPVRVRIVEAETGARASARLHVHGPAGEYLPPRGHHRTVSTALFEDSFADFAVDDHQYAYVDGECIVDLPLGEVFVEITRGTETAPIRRQLTVDAGTTELTFQLASALR